MCSLTQLASSPEAPKTPATPPPPSNLGRVPNIQYFQNQWIFVEKLLAFVPPLSWDLVPSKGVKWLSYDDPSEQYTPDNPHIELGIILIGQLGSFLTLKSAENNFNTSKPEFMIQLEVEDQSLDILRELLSRRGDGYSITNPLRIKVPQSDLLSTSFDSGDPFPDCFDGTLTTDNDDGPKLEASIFTPGDKVAVQVWFGSYKFTDKSKETRLGATIRLLKIWRLQASISTELGSARSPVTPRKLQRRS